MLNRGSLGLIGSAQGLYTAALIDGFICTDLGLSSAEERSANRHDGSQACILEQESTR